MDIKKLKNVLAEQNSVTPDEIGIQTGLDFSEFSEDYDGNEVYAFVWDSETETYTAFYSAPEEDEDEDEDGEDEDEDDGEDDE